MIRLPAASICSRPSARTSPGSPRPLDRSPLAHPCQQRSAILARVPRRPFDASSISKLRASDDLLSREVLDRPARLSVVTGLGNTRLIATAEVVYLRLFSAGCSTSQPRPNILRRTVLGVRDVDGCGSSRGRCRVFAEAVRRQQWPSGVRLMPFQVQTRHLEIWWES
jgi:hypothetical protein